MLPSEEPYLTWKVANTSLSENEKSNLEKLPNQHFLLHQLFHRIEEGNLDEGKLDEPISAAALKGKCHHLTVSLHN